MKILFLPTIALCLIAATAAQGATSSFLVANNDVSTGFGSTVTFYAINADGSLSNRNTIATDGVGSAGGTFAYSRIALAPQSTDVCVFASNAESANIASISASTQTLLGTFAAAATDSGSTNGIGLAANAHFLYAMFSTTGTIATFAIQSGCSLAFLGDVTAVGLNGGVPGGMAIHGSMMVVTYGDGSIESFNASKGVPVSNGDAENSAGSVNDHIPNGVDITADGHYAIFGDASTVTTVEVSDISSGRLTPTTAYTIGGSWNSGNIRLTPDEAMLLVTNESGGDVTAARFDKSTGKVTPGCTSGPLKNFYSTWSFAGALAMQQASGAGGLIYVPEFGSNGFSSIGVVQFASTGTACTLTETASSPVIDDTDPSALLSIGIYPQRRF